MSEKELKFSRKELTEILIRHADAHEGFWGVVVEFGFAAANTAVAGPDGNFSIKPTALVAVNTVGIKRFNEAQPFTVDAAEVNPPAVAPRRGKREKKAAN